MSGLIHLPGVAGCDEAGRGPLAGPVVCGAVVLPEAFDTEGIRDSKKLSPAQRRTAADRIREGADWSVCIVDSDEIDRINILQASLVGMARCLERLSVTPFRALIDGNKVPGVAPCECEFKIKGDELFACIAAASILAKTVRDQLMIDVVHVQYPEYGFDKHFGYPTPEHLAALQEHGPCPIHRRTFAPVSLLLAQPVFDF